MSKIKKITIAVILIIVLIGGFLIALEKHRSEETIKSETVFEGKMVEMVRASINLYRALHNSYPYSMKVMLADLGDDVKAGRIKSDVSESVDTTQKAIAELKDFNFSLRGDGEAYQITYTDSEGNKKVIEENYNKEFH
jgi:hypothetical protein